MRSETARLMVSSGVRSPNSWLIWKVRAMPSLTRRCEAYAVMSRPSSRMRPAVGRSTPVRRLISVVLPAPFGPISAWRAPFSTFSETLLVAVEPAEASFQAYGLEHRRRHGRSSGAVDAGVRGVRQSKRAASARIGVVQEEMRSRPISTMTVPAAGRSRTASIAA